MLNSLSLLRAMNGIHEEDVVMAGNTYFEKRDNYGNKDNRFGAYQRGRTDLC